MSGRSTAETLSLALGAYSVEMRERLAEQKKAMRMLLDSIAMNVSDARTMMRQLNELSFEGDILEIEKVLAGKKKAPAKPAAKKKKPAKAKKTATKSGKTKPKAKAKAPAKASGTPTTRTAMRFTKAKGGKK